MGKALKIAGRVGTGKGEGKAWGVLVCSSSPAAKDK